VQPFPAGTEISLVQYLLSVVIYDADHDLKQASVPPRRLIQSQQYEAGAMRQFLLIAVVADLLAASGGTTVPEGYRARLIPKICTRS
jgi:hypothetical protein